MAEWIHKNKIQLYAAHKRLTLILRTCMKIKGWKKTFQANGNHKRVGVAILISDKIVKNCHKNQDGHYLMTKGSICQKDIKW